MNQKKYYTAQEVAYQKIKERGEVGWQTKTMQEFRNLETEKILNDFISKWKIIQDNQLALDIGTGTGTTAHFLHDIGFKVTGIDVCPTAIEHAREIAQTEKKDIHFEVLDALDLNQSFHFIYDSHCMHCVVFEEDRARFYKMIRQSLKQKGHFLLDSMALKDDGGIPDFDDLFFDDDYILWHKAQNNNFTGTKLIDGVSWCPQRRIYPVSVLKNELTKYGFEIIDSSTESQNEDPNLLMFRALCVPI